MKKSLLIFTLLASGQVFAECELDFEKPSDVATCYEKQSSNDILKKYQKLLTSTTDKEEKNQLIQSHIAWKKYQDSYCKNYSNYHREVNNHANCIINLNRQRLEQLQADLDTLLPK